MKKTIAIIILAIVAAACFGGCMYTQNIYEELEVNYVLAVSARENYKEDIKQADEIFAQIGPSVNDEQRALIEEWRKTRTRSIEEVTEEFNQSMEKMQDAANDITENMEKYIDDLKGDQQ